MKKASKRMRKFMAIALAALFKPVNAATAYAYNAGAERSLPDTGDSMAIFVWILALFVALGGIITAIIMLFHNKKK